MLMKGFASLIMRGRMQAVMFVAACAVLSLIFPLVGYLGAAAIALVTLRLGAKEGLGLAILGTIATAILSAFISGQVGAMLVLSLLQWLPVWGIALILRSTASQALALASAVVLLAVLVLGFYIAVDDPQVWWSTVISRMLDPMIENQGLKLAQSDIDILAGLMTGLAAAGSLLGIIISVLLGRWWQSVLYNPGGFGTEFRSLRMPRVFAVTGFILVVAGMMFTNIAGNIARDLLMLMLVLYLMQGLSLIHALVAYRKASVGWLFATYILVILFPPYGLMMVSGSGYVDTWLDMRSRFKED